MVTVITDKLRQQTLDDITSTTRRIQIRNPKKVVSQEESFDLSVRKPSSSKGGSQAHHKHRRSHSRGQQQQQHEQEQSPLASSIANKTARCNSYPPAKKRICRSHSDPYKDSEIQAFWTPEPSSIWTPVKPSTTSICDHRSGGPTSIIRPTGARSLEFTNKELYSWSTPPESPIPRPVSANSVLQDSTFFPLRLISEEHDEVTSRGDSSLLRGCGVEFTNSLPRSHSHPCFSNIPASNNGLKRRLSEIDIPRPALDFDKMKARAFINPSLQKRTLKYSSKRHSSTSPKILKCDKPLIQMNLAVDLSSTLLITPTASPTNCDEVKTIYERHTDIHDENSNTSRTSFSLQDCFGCTTPTINTDLDINLIEEDGTR